VTHEELRAILTDLGVSQVELAKAAGVTYRAAKFWAAGDRKIPSRVVALLRQAMQRGYWIPESKGGDAAMKPKKPKGGKPC
jgi:transcriptional regulator with XRE-family HTH domain